jgi:hypothetical protein
MLVLSTFSSVSQLLERGYTISRNMRLSLLSFTVITYILLGIAYLLTRCSSRCQMASKGASCPPATQA